MPKAQSKPRGLASRLLEAKCAADVALNSAIVLTRAIEWFAQVGREFLQVTEGPNKGKLYLLYAKYTGTGDKRTYKYVHGPTADSATDALLLAYREASGL